MNECSICDNESCGNDKWQHFNLCLEHIAEMAELEIDLKLKEGNDDE